MATMSAKLKGKAEVVRRLNKERKEFKQVLEFNKTNTVLRSIMLSLYWFVFEARVCKDYSKTELHKMLDMCIKAVERENKKRG
ncbi:MAG: hypothetical protein HY096_09825 [Nitrospinae bacterium]|nr:hypothetical protein [Nitrospinota bacterium]